MVKPLNICTFGQRYQPLLERYADKFGSTKHISNGTLISILSSLLPPVLCPSQQPQGWACLYLKKCQTLSSDLTWLHGKLSSERSASQRCPSNTPATSTRCLLLLSSP